MSRAIIFDMDGTLFQTDRILERSLEDTFTQLRSQGLWDIATPIEKYCEIMGVPLPKVWETLLPQHSLEVREQADVYFQNRLIENIISGKGALYPNVKEVLSYLKANDWSIYIASNGLVNYLEAIVGYYHLDDWVTETFSIEQIESLNKSELVRSVINKYEITTGAVVGDRLSDINAAKDNGLVAIGCRFDFSLDEELAKADVVVNDLLELKEIMTGNKSLGEGCEVGATTKLPLTDDEKSKLRKAKIKMADLHTFTRDEIAHMLDVSDERATILKGLADFQSVPSIGDKLAGKLVHKLNVYSLEEIKDQDAASLFDKLEQINGVLTDSCVEDQIRCVIHFANNPGSSKQWFDFTEERKAYREKYGFPDNSPRMQV